MSILDDLKAAGIECPEVDEWQQVSTAFMWRISPSDLRRYANTAIDAALRLAIGYKGERDLLRAVIERVRYHEGDSFVDDMFAQVRMADGEQEATA